MEWSRQRRKMEGRKDKSKGKKKLEEKKILSQIATVFGQHLVA